MVVHITQVYNFFRSQFFSCSVYYFAKLLKKVILCRELFIIVNHLTILGYQTYHSE